MSLSVRFAGSASDIFPVDIFKFSAGEIQLKCRDLPDYATFNVVAHLNNSDDIMELLLLDEILRRKKSSGSSLLIPYLPYGRQDRVMHDDEAFSLKVMAKLLNGLYYDTIKTFDCHSPVTNALIDKLEEIKQADIVCDCLREKTKDSFLIAPDAGAAKKTFEIGKRLRLPVVVAEKVRDTTTGEISHTKVNAGAAGGKAFIIDDICDGGRTFIELAKVLKGNGFGEIFLYVTHGIFSQGLDVFNGLIDGIFTTNTFKEQPEHPLLTTFKIIE